MITRNSTGPARVIDTNRMPKRPQFLPSRLQLLDIACWLAVVAVVGAISAWAVLQVLHGLASAWLP